LRKLELDEKSTPQEFRGLDLDGIRKFLSSLDEESTTTKQQKLLILGKEGYGKTSLLHFLQWNKPIGPSTKSTDGIDISTWKMSMKKTDNMNEEEILFSCWDFAGQRVCLCFFFKLALTIYF
jgi:GTPase SAR1 family protein